MKRPKRKPRQDISPRPRKYAVLRDPAPEPETIPQGTYPYYPAPVSPAPLPRTRQVTYGEWTGTMTINLTSGPIPWDQRCQDAFDAVKLKAKHLTRARHLSSVDEIAETHCEAAGHLLGELPPKWEPRSEAADGPYQDDPARIRWYKPGTGDQGERLPHHQRPEPQPGPWYHPYDPSGVYAAALQAFRDTA